MLGLIVGVRLQRVGHLVLDLVGQVVGHLDVGHGESGGFVVGHLDEKIDIKFGPESSFSPGQNLTAGILHFNSKFAFFTSGTIQSCHAGKDFRLEIDKSRKHLRLACLSCK